MSIRSPKPVKIGRSKSLVEFEEMETNFQLVELKDSPWQLSTFANVEKFVVYAPNELYILPDIVRSEIIRVYGNKRGFVVLLDRLASIELSRFKIKAAFFVQFTLDKFEADPLKAEQLIRGCFKTSNPYLYPTIRLNHGLTRHNPNPSIALVGTRAELKRQLTNAAHVTSSVDLVLLPVGVCLKNIENYVSRGSLSLEIGVNLGQFLDSAENHKSVRYVLTCVTLHGRPKGQSGTEVETFLVINLPSGKRNLGEATSVAASRVLLEQTGLIRQISDHNSVCVLFSPDRSQKTFVEELSEEPPAPILPDINAPHVLSKAPSRSLLRIFPSLSGSGSVQSSPKSESSPKSSTRGSPSRARLRSESLTHRDSVSSLKSISSSPTVSPENVDTSRFFPIVHAAVRLSIDEFNNNSLKEFQQQQQTRKMSHNNFEK